MLRGKFNYPDLDVPDSPLFSANPVGSFSAIPGSALAERIFNDPESWGEDDADDSDVPDDVNDLAWLAEEFERVVQSAGIGAKGAFDNQTPTEKTMNLVSIPPSVIPRDVEPSLKRDPTAVWKGVGKKGHNVRPISLAALFEHSKEDFSSEIQQQLSKILETGGIHHHIRSFPHSSALSPPSTSGTNSSLNTPLHLQTLSDVGNGGEDSPSPINVYSASATLSFLEWYGIYPDSPRLDLNGRRRSILQPKSSCLRTPALQVPSPRHASRPNSFLTTPLAEPLVSGAGSKRASSVPPPGLDVPSNVTETRSVTTPPRQGRTPSPAPQRQPTHTRSDSSFSESSCAPPPYSQIPLPAPPPSRTSQDASISTSSGGRGRDVPSRTPSGMSRRLPSIPPPEAADNSRTSTPPPPQAQAQVQPTPPQRVPSRTGRSTNVSRSNTPPQASTANVLQYVSVRNASPSPMGGSVAQAQSDGFSRMTSMRSPQGPAGPRTRGRGSRDSGATGILSTMGQRPPGLRI